MSFDMHGVSANGKILQWNGQSVAISKINSVDLSFKKRKFPIIALVIGIIFFFVIFSKYFIYGLLGVAIAAVWIWWWKNHKIYDYVVNLRTSSTEPFVIYFGDNYNAGSDVKTAILNEINQL